MKTIVITLAMFASFSASAADPGVCAALATYANNVATAHQAGVPLEKTIEIARASGLEDILMPVVTRAYSMPRYTTKSVQEREIARFRDAEHLRCIKG